MLKPRIICLHGWGQSAQIWYQQNGVQTLQLPGHGGRSALAADDWLANLEQQLLRAANDQPFILMGWSLGGQLALALEQRMRAQKLIRGLVLVSCTPCFRQQPDWVHGCNDEVWHGFNQAAERADARLMSRFFNMMLHGDILDKAKRHQLVKHAVQRDFPPSLDGLKAGLCLLDCLDERHTLQSISLPTLIIHGQQDAIVPLQAGQYLAEHIANSTLHTFADCGHAPFLTHHAEFNRILELWCPNISV